MAKVLVTGASGFIGKNLISHLLDKGHEVYGLYHNKNAEVNHQNFHLLQGDLRNSEISFPSEIQAAYYLVHSMGQTKGTLLATEEETTRNFVKALEKTDCEQIIYLGGIIEDEAKLSPHLTSRLNVENILKNSKISTTLFRASIIIGKTSASFEIIKDLVDKLPVMVAPKWVNSLCQPIAINDVLFYLIGVLLNKETYGQSYEIGGPDTLSFKQVLLQYAAYKKLKRWIINVPFLTPRLSSYWLFFVTSVKFSICFYLVESMKSNSICKDKKIQKVLPHNCLSYQEAIELAC